MPELICLFIFFLVLLWVAWPCEEEGNALLSCYGNFREVCKS